MGWRVKGTLIKVGKDQHYAVRYQAEGRQIKAVLRDEHNRYIYKKPQARVAADKLLEPLWLKDDVLKAQALQGRVDAAQEKVQRTEQAQANEQCTLETGWDLFLSCPDLPQSLVQHAQSKDIPKHSNISNYRGYYRRFCGWCSTNLKGKSSWAEITTADAQAFVKYLCGQFESGTVGKYITFFKMFYTKLIDNETITCRNPFSKITKPPLKTERRESLTEDEVKSLKSKAEGEYRTLIRLGAYAGMRLGDACLLTWDNVDFENNQIRYIPHKTANRRKSSKGEVVVELPSFLQRNLLSLKQMCKKGEKHVLPLVARHYKTNEVSRYLNSLFDDCGIKRHRDRKSKGGLPVLEKSFHSLRHWFASYCAEQGVPEQTVQSVLGHSSSAMTDYYTHITPTALAAVSGVMEEFDPEPAEADPLPEKKEPGDDPLGIIQPEFGF